MDTLKESDVLLSDYIRGRDDERGFYAAMGATVAGAIAIMGLIINALSSADCLHWKASSKCTLDDSIIALLPLLLIAGFAYQTWLGIDATFRSFYLRGIEKRIRDELPVALPSSTRPYADLDIPLASFVSLTSIAHSQTRFKQPVSFLTALIWSVMSAVVTVLISISWIQVQWGWKIAMLAIYAPSISIIIYSGMLAFFKGRRYVKGILLAFKHQSDKKSNGAIGSASSRTPIGYFLVPGADHIPVAAVTLLGFCAPFVAGWTPAPLVSSWSGFLIPLIAFEIFLQQSKYAFNDIRSIADDSAHPLRHIRGRLDSLGVSIKTGLLVALASICWRLVVFLSFVLLMPGYRLPLWLSLAGLTILVGVYETLRSLRPKAHQMVAKAVLSIAIVFWIGLGYALRVWFGWSYANGSVVLPGIGWVSCAFASAFGSLMCILTWEIEAATYVFVEPDTKRQICQTSGRIIKGPGWLAASIHFKPHVAWLSRWSIPSQLKSEPTIDASSEQSLISLQRLPVIKLSMPIDSPHIYVGSIAIVLSSMTGFGLASWMPWVFVLINILLLVWVTRMRLWSWRWEAVTGAAALANFLVWVCLVKNTTYPGELYNALLWLAIALFGGSYPARIFGIRAQIMNFVRTAVRTLFKWVLGPKAYDALTARTSRSRKPISHN